MLRPDPGLFEAAYKRVSRRSYQLRPAPGPALDELDQLIDRFRSSEPEMRMVLGREGAERIFQGRTGYGMIVGAVSYVALIAKSEQAETMLRIGYYGEWLVLTAVKLGLSTCWVAGTFNRAAAESLLALQAGEVLVCVVPVGESAPVKTFRELAVSTLIRSRKRKPLGEILSGCHPDQLAVWQKAALECARIAPSGINLQPWRFSKNGERMRIGLSEGKTPHGTATIDCGIAMLHFSVGACHAGIHGTWTIAPEPYLAEFVPDKTP